MWFVGRSVAKIAAPSCWLSITAAHPSHSAEADGRSWQNGALVRIVGGQQPVRELSEERLTNGA
jgi:hypothetical protein